MFLAMLEGILVAESERLTILLSIGPEMVSWFGPADQGVFLNASSNPVSTMLTAGIEQP